MTLCKSCLTPVTLESQLEDGQCAECCERELWLENIDPHSLIEIGLSLATKVPTGFGEATN